MRDLANGRYICEVDGLGDVCVGEGDRTGIAVDRNDAMAGVARVTNRRELRDARAEEEQRRHGYALSRTRRRLHSGEPRAAHLNGE